MEYAKYKVPCITNVHSILTNTNVRTLVRDRYKSWHNGGVSLLRSWGIFPRTGQRIYFTMRALQLVRSTSLPVRRTQLRSLHTSPTNLSAITSIGRTVAQHKGSCVMRSPLTKTRVVVLERTVGRRWQSAAVGV